MARYEFRVVSRGHAPPGDYRVDVTRYLVGKLDARSFGPPVDGVANVGPLLNEATTKSGEVTNCARTATELTGSQGRRRGAFFLCTTREVHVGHRTSDATVHATCLPKTDLQSVRQGVLSIDMEYVCVHWGFNIGLALV